MGFIGNDIIALNDPANRRSFCDERYLRKVLTCKEYSLFKKKPKCSYLPYMFWTCKESAYKVAMKKGYSEKFIPQFFEVLSFHSHQLKSVSVITGQLIFENEKIFFRAEIFPGFISTIACSEDILPGKITTGIGLTDDVDHSEKNREYLIASLSLEYKIAPQKIEVLKSDKGIPFIVMPGIKIPTDISFSHDGIFFSFAYINNQ